MPLSSLRPRLAALPAAPGVYLFKGADGKALYIGKAKSLRDRVRSYFGDDPEFRHLLPRLKKEAADLEWIVTDTEKEALILENTLIKDRRPPCNISLRDDKAYLCLRLDPREEWPRFRLVRRPRADGSRLFGPFASGSAARQTVKFLQRAFPLRSCTDLEFKGRTRPCLNHEIGSCAGPCCGLVTREAYAGLVSEASAFLEGRRGEILSSLRARMEEQADRLAFEDAARTRDRIAAIEKTLERQKVARPGGPLDRDVFGLFRDGTRAVVCHLAFRDGKLLSARNHPLNRLGGTDAAVVRAFLGPFYAGATAFVPPEILVPVPPDEAGLLAEWLCDRRGSRVEIRAPSRGEGARLVAMARRNAESSLRAGEEGGEAREEALAEIERALSLSNFPEEIECYDISNLGGGAAVGAKVAFSGGAPEKSRWRRYRIRTAEGPDDFAMIKEALVRRLKRLAEEGRKPDLVIVDGGRGQLSAALEAFRECDVLGVDVAAMAKERPPGEGAPSPDRLFLPGREEPVLLEPGSPGLRLLQRIRDETHRFAVTYHRKVRSRERIATALLDVPGVGAATGRKLLRTFGSVRALRAVPPDEIAARSGVPRKVAENVAAYLARR